MFVSTRGAGIFYSTRGNGPVCIVLSSIGTKPYEMQMPVSLSDRLTLVFVALRGSGESTGRAADLDFDVLAEDLECIRTALGAKRVAILGHSIIGVLALEYARRCPASISHVITVGTPPKGDMSFLTAASTAYFEKHASEERKQILRDNLAKLVAGAAPEQAMLAQTPLRFFDPRFDAGPLNAGAVVKPEFFMHLLGPLTSGWDVTVNSSSLNSPIFLAQGRHDYVVPYVLWDGITQCMPDTTLHIFERSGHQPFLEEPELFSETLLDWMSRRQ